MTRKEIKEWAAETVNKIFHGHGLGERSTVHIQGRVTEVGKDRISVEVPREKYGSVHYFFCTKHPDFYKVGEIVSIEIVKV